MIQYPAGWRRTRLKYVADCNARSLAEETDPGFTFDYVDISSVTQGQIASGLERVWFATAPSRARRLARPGSALISTVRTYLRAIAVVPESATDLVFSTGFAVLDGHPDLIDDRFLAFYIQSDPLIDRIAAASVGVSYPAINASEIMAFDLWLPDLEEQRAIAGFLDRETAKIDALIEKQNELVSLLRERRECAVESVLENAGPSGALGFFAQCLPGYAFAADDFSHDEQDTRLLRGINVKVRTTDWTDVVYWPREAATGLARYQLMAGDIVLGMDRPFIGDGTRVAVIQERDLPCLLLQRVLRVRPREHVSSKFLYLALMTRSFREYATPEFTGVSVPHISDKQVRSFRLNVPDLAEQRNLAVRIELDVAKIDALIVKAEEFVSFARERRAALITAAVTGQIDVTQEAS